jgi:hypothetical protein
MKGSGKSIQAKTGNCQKIARSSAHLRILKIPEGMTQLPLLDGKCEHWLVSMLQVLFLRPGGHYAQIGQPCSSVHAGSVAEGAVLSLARFDSVNLVKQPHSP